MIEDKDLTQYLSTDLKKLGIEIVECQGCFLAEWRTDEELIEPSGYGGYVYCNYLNMKVGDVWALSQMPPHDCPLTNKEVFVKIKLYTTHENSITK